MPETRQPAPPAALPDGLGRLVLIGMAIGVVVMPLVVYVAVGLFGPPTLLTCAHGNQDNITCSARQLVLTGMAVPLGALIGFFVGYRVACRRFNARR